MFGSSTAYCWRCWRHKSAALYTPADLHQDACTATVDPSFVQRLLVLGPHEAMSDHQLHDTSDRTAGGQLQELLTSHPQNMYNSASDNSTVLHSEQSPVTVPRVAAASPTTAAAVKQPDGWPAWQRVAARTWQMALAMFFLYVVTLFIFPGVLAEDAQVGRVCMQQHIHTGNACLHL